MEYLVLGFFTGLSLILAIGAQNIFVIEQGLKKQHVFLVCFVCSISDLILIFLGIFLLSFGPDNRLKQHFIAYLDYFDMNKRVIYHLKNSKTIFSSQAECQLIYHDLNKDQIMKLLDGGKVDFKRSIKNPNPCQLFFVTNRLLDNNLTVAFELCQIVEKTTTVLYFQINDESITCLD